MPITIVVLFLCVIVMAFGVSTLLNKIIIHKAVNKFIRPTMIAKGFCFLHTKSVGLFRSGGFEEEFSPRPFMLGYPVVSIYVYVYYTTQDQTNYRMTAKISSFLIFPFKVEYLTPQVANSIDS